jgi:hypothetical protein
VSALEMQFWMMFGCFIVLTVLASGPAWGAETVAGGWRGLCKQSIKVTGERIFITGAKNYKGVDLWFSPAKVFTAKYGEEGILVRGRWQQTGNKVVLNIRDSLKQQLMELLKSNGRKGALGQVRYSQKGSVQNGRLEISVIMPGEVTVSGFDGGKCSFVANHVIQGTRATRMLDLSEAEVDGYLPNPKSQGVC